MKRLTALIISLFLIGAALISVAADMGPIVKSSAAEVSGELPVINISTDSGVSVTEKVYEGASMSVQLTDKYAEYTSPYTEKEGDRILIRCRGNSTYETKPNRLGDSGKYSYKIKLDSKANMLGIGESKHWVLLANYYDVTHMKVLVERFEPLIDFDLHIIEFYLNTVEQGVVIRRSGSYLIKRVYHLDDTVENTFGKHEAEVARGCVERGSYKGFLNSLGCRSLSANEVAKALNDDAATEHIAESCDRLSVAVGVLKGLGEVLCNEKRKVGVARLLCGILIAVTVNCYDTIGIFIYYCTLRIHTERANFVAVFWRSVNDLAFIKLIRQM